MILILLIGIVGNTLTIATVVNAKKNHSQEFHIFSHSSTPLLLHLAVCDILYYVVGIPSFFFIFRAGYFPLSEIFCRIVAMAR